MAFQRWKLFVRLREKGDGVCTLPECGGRGPTTHLFSVADSDTTFVDLLG